MKLFSSLYNRMIHWSKHPHAPIYLGTLSFAESSFFPIPPDVMLAPMALAKPQKAWSYAMLTTLTSVLGGLFGYLLGFAFFPLVYKLIVHFGYESTYQLVQTWFTQWGFWIMFFAGFAFIPYKIFTIAAGAAHMALLPFTLGSFVGRGGRFFLVAALIRIGGIKFEQYIAKYIEYIGWAMILLLLLLYLVYHH